MCLICGRLGKHVGSSAFYNISTALPSTDCGNVTIGHRLRDILRLELPRKRLVPSDDVCRKCYRQLTEIDYLESQVISHPIFQNLTILNQFLSLFSFDIARTIS